MKSPKGFVVEKDGFYRHRIPKNQTEAGRAAFGLALSAAGFRIVKANVTAPSIKTLEKYSYNGIAKAVDGCKVEPDGTCQHGAPSWLLALGFI